MRYETSPDVVIHPPHFVGGLQRTLQCLRITVAENASFLPWLTMTAFLHSVMVQEKRGMLKKKNVILVSIDSPRKTQLSVDLKKQNDMLKQKFQIRGFPIRLPLAAFACVDPFRSEYLRSKARVVS